MAKGNTPELLTENDGFPFRDREKFSLLYARYGKIIFSILAYVSDDSELVDTLFTEVWSDLHEESASIHLNDPGNLGRVLCFVRKRLVNSGLSVESLSKATYLKVIRPSRPVEDQVDSILKVNSPGWICPKCVT